MGTTDRGIVYPESEDHTRLWEHFQTLAESLETALDNALEALPQSGTTEHLVIVAGVTNSVPVTFAVPFSVKPHVVATPLATVAGVNQVSVSDVTTTGCVIRLVRSANSPRVLVDWIAAVATV